MKYRITSVKQIRRPLTKRVFKCRRCRLPRPFVSVEHVRGTAERISFDTLFEIGELEAPKRLSVSERLRRKTASFILSVKKLIKKAFSRSQLNAPTRIWLYVGGLVSAVLVFILSAAVCLLSLFSPFLSSYQRLTAPSLVGMSVSEAQALIDPRFEVAISYKSSNDAKAGVILSQFPEAGTERKLYKNKVCVLSLTISSGKGFRVVEDLKGQDQRDALLSLRNKGIALSTVYEYSNNAAAGTVISTSPAAGERLFDGDRLIITVSRGKRVSTVSVPDLYLLNEAQALSALKSKGLNIGKVKYETSDVPAGKIIAQSAPAYSRSSKGATVDITVSLGKAYVQRTVPDLFGLTVEDAERELARHGLVIGGIYTVSSAASTETVVSQSPMAGTPITSQITSVDVYISTN